MLIVCTSMTLCYSLTGCVGLFGTEESCIGRYVRLFFSNTSQNSEPCTHTAQEQTTYHPQQQPSITQPPHTLLTLAFLQTCMWICNSPSVWLSSCALSTSTRRAPISSILARGQSFVQPPQYTHCPNKAHAHPHIQTQSRIRQNHTKHKTQLRTNLPLTMRSVEGFPWLI